MKKISDESKQTGVALVLVLWVLALLSVIVGEFCHAMRTEVNIVRNFKEQTQAYYIAKAGLATSIVKLIEMETQPPKPPDMLQDEQIAEDEFEWRINVDIPDVAFSNGAFAVNIGNEAGKVNINMAQENIIRMLLGTFDLDDHDKDVIVDSILDWRDQDNLHRLNGAEDDYYQSLEKPYPCKDAIFESVDELLMVKGVTSEIFHGGLKDMVTVYVEDDASLPPGVKRVNPAKPAANRSKQFNYNKININFAPPAVLSALPQMTQDLVGQIIEFRKEKDLTMPDLLEIVGAAAYAEMGPFITTAKNAKSPFFTITCHGKLDISPVTHQLEILVRIDTKLKTKYQIHQWIDRG